MFKQALLIIRPINILILCLTQFSLWFKLGFESTKLFQFLILCSSAALIAAAGYLVNDIYDYEIDLHNKPAKVFVNQHFSKNNSWAFYFILNFTALVLSLFLKIELLIINILSIVLLFFYSSNVKKITPWGNLIIALLSAATVFEIALLVNSKDFKINSLLLFYILFSFLTTLIREIVKDLEDIHGDIAFKRKTLAIYLGIYRTKILLSVINFSMLIALFLSYFYFQSKINFFSETYMIILVTFPLYIFLLLLSAREKNNFEKLSFVLKLYMLLGICWLWTF
jgi:4-hydroxybenzoate polyprenyltransferase